MENLEDFRKTALVLLFPDGSITKALVDKRLIHLRYYIDLYHQDENFKKFVDKNGVYIPENFFDSKMIVTYEIDKALARVGVVALHNLFIFETLTDDGYIENVPPQFYITLPSELTDEQKNVIRELCNNHDMSCSLYGMYMDDELDDITYDEFMHILNNKKK